MSTKILNQAGDVGERVDPVQLAAFGERIPDRGGMASPLIADTKDVFLTKGDRARRQRSAVLLSISRRPFSVNRQIASQLFRV